MAVWESPHLVLTAIVDPSGLPLPRTYYEAINGPEGPLWKAAIQSEYDSQKKKGTFSAVYLPAGRRPLTLKLVLKRKIGPDGRIAKYKARLCARGFQQREGIDFNEVFAAVVKPATYRLLFRSGNSLWLGVGPMGRSHRLFECCAGGGHLR